MARVVKGTEKEVATRSARSGVCSQTGATLVKRGLYCAVRVRCALRVAVCAHRLAQLLQREACTVLCACVVPCVRVQCARALRVHTRGYTHLISANGFRFDARGNARCRNSSSIVKFAARGGRIPGLKHRGEPGHTQDITRFTIPVREKAVERGGVHTADGSLALPPPPHAGGAPLLRQQSARVRRLRLHGCARASFRPPSRHVSPLRSHGTRSFGSLSLATRGAS